MDDATREHWEKIADEVIDRAWQKAEANAQKDSNSADEAEVTDATRLAYVEGARRRAEGDDHRFPGPGCGLVH